MVGSSGPPGSFAEAHTAALQVKVWFHAEEDQGAVGFLAEWHDGPSWTMLGAEHLTQMLEHILS